MEPYVEKVLTSSIDSLPLSEDFKNATIQQGYHTLNEIMSMPITELVNLKWFTSEMLKELGEFIYETRNDENSKH